MITERPWMQKSQSQARPSSVFDGSQDPEPLGVMDTSWASSLCRRQHPLMGFQHLPSSLAALPRAHVALLHSPHSLCTDAG
jgi:hypothetical protein